MRNLRLLNHYARVSGVLCCRATYTFNVPNIAGEYVPRFTWLPVRGFEYQRLMEENRKNEIRR